MHAKLMSSYHTVVSSMYVCVNDLLLCCHTGTIWEVNCEVSEAYSKLMTQFSKLMRETYKLLLQKEVPVQSFAVYLIGIKSNMKLKVNSEDEVKLNDVKEWIDLFDELSNIRAWDCLNYTLLRDMINEHLQDSEAVKQLQRYEGRVQHFMENTLLMDFLDIYKELFPDDSYLRNGCTMLKAKLKGDLSKETLYDLYNTRGYLTTQFRLQHYVLRLATANEGCVILYWYIPQCAVHTIHKVCKELQPDFGQAGIIELCIDDSVLYQVSSEPFVLCNNFDLSILT